MLVNRERAVELMEREGLDALVTTTPENVYYLSDFGTLNSFRFPLMGVFAAILPRNPDVPPTLILGEWDLPDYLESPSWMPEVRVQTGMGIYAPEDRELSAVDRRLKELLGSAHATGASNRQRLLGATLVDLGLGRARLGFDDVRVMLELQEHELAEGTVREAVALFREIRIVKTPDEIHLLGRASHAVQSAIEGMRDLCVEGVTPRELLGFFRSSMALQGGYGSHLAAVADGPRRSGRRTVAAHGSRGTIPNMDTHLRDGDILFMDPAGHYGHYWADIGRTMVLGDPPGRLEEFHSTLQDAHAQAQSMMEPGVETAAVKQAIARAVTDVIPEQGLMVLIHSIGIDQYDNPEPLGEFLQSDFTIENEMVLNIETVYTELGWGSMQLEDTYYVHDSTVDRMSTLPMELFRPGGSPAAYSASELG
jgi:Xaa-Pro aminopeptidase